MNRLRSTRIGRTGILLGLLLTISAGEVHAQEALEVFVDPAPPRVHPVQEARAPSAKPHPRGKTLASPRPLSKNAMVEDWPTFLGESSQASSRETELLKRLEELTALWEVARGESYAAPSVARGRVIHFHRQADEEIVESLDAVTGELYWRHSYSTQYRDPYNFGTGPKCAPLILEDRVITYGIEGRLHCLDWHTGQRVWERDLKREFGIGEQFFGLGASPIRFEDKIIINVGGQEGPTVAAFEARTGKMVWGAGREWGPSYASPVLFEVHGEPRALVFAGGRSRPPHGGLMCIDPRNGKVDFSIPFRGRRFESANAANPVVSGDRVMISSSYNTGSVCLRISETFQAEEIWRVDHFGAHFSTGYVESGRFYGIDGASGRAASLVCLDWDTGDELWRERLEWDELPRPASQRQGGLYSIGLGSLLKIDGHTLALGEFGHLLWLDLDPEGPEVIDRTWLFCAPETWTPPIVSHGLLYICQNQRGPDGPRRLRCYDLRGDD